MKQFVGPTYTETASGKIFDLADPQQEDIDIADIAWGLSRQNRFAGHTIAKKTYSVAQHTVQVSRIAEQALTKGNEFYEMFQRYIESRLDTAVEANMNRDHGASMAEDLTFKDAIDARDAFYRIVNTGDFNFKAIIVFHALMHDFAEAYLIDVPTPVKRLPGVYEAYRAAEEKMDNVIFTKFKLGYADKWPDNRKFGELVVKWADMIALKIEAYHMMPSRGLAWNLPQEQPSLQLLNAFRWPISSEQACAELLARFEELRPKEMYE